MVEFVTATGGVVVGWLLAQVADLSKLRREKKAAAAYLGASVLIQLESFIHDCAVVAGDDGTSRGQPAGRYENGEEYYLPQKPSPHITWDGLAVDWKSIEPRLMHSILSIPLELAGTKHELEGVAEHDDPPYDSYMAARQLRYAQLGVMVANVAEKLRLATNMPKRPIKDWDPETYLRRRAEELRAREESIAAANLASWPNQPTSGAPTTGNP